MKDKNKFVLSYMGDNFESLFSEYKEIKKQLELDLQKKEKFEKAINQRNYNTKELTFRDQVILVKTLGSLLNKNPYDYDLESLYYKILFKYRDVDLYENIDNIINNKKRSIRDILIDKITFDHFRKDEFEERCECCGHILVNFDDELKCLFCNATTKDYGLTKEEVDFLTLCAEKQGLLFKEIKKEDLTFVQVLLNKSEEDREERNKRFMEEYRNTDEDLRMDLEAEQFYSDEGENRSIKFLIRDAHLLDDKKYDEEIFSIKCFNIFEENETKKLLDNIEQELEKIKTSDSRFKDFMIEECNTAKYEVLILSGKHIPTLVEEVTNEDDMIALTKAYYNLYNSRTADYFENKEKDHWFKCVTANPKINNKILEMKVRR